MHGQTTLNVEKMLDTNGTQTTTFSGARAWHAGYLRQEQRHTIRICNPPTPLQGNNGYKKAPHSYIIRTLPVYLLSLRISSPEL